MHVAKIKQAILDGKEPFAGVVVAATDFYCANCFGQDGYDEDPSEEYAVVPVEVAISKGASTDDVYRAARTVGIDAELEELNPNQILLDPRAVAELVRQGFDGHVGYEVIGNANYDVRTVWDMSQVTVLPEPADAADFSLTEGERGGLLIKAETSRGRVRLSKAFDAWYAKADMDSISDVEVLAREGVLKDFVLNANDQIEGPDGRLYLVEHHLIPQLVDQGHVGLSEIVPAPSP